MEKNHLTPQFFFIECKNFLGFLSKEYKFSKPELKVHKDVALFKVIFYKRHIAIECAYDVRDGMPSLYITKLEDGKMPDCYRVNEKGEVVREYLTALLIARGTRDIKFCTGAKDQSLSKEQNQLRNYLSGSARLLKLYGQDILNDSTTIFDNISPNNGDRF